jgi:zinc protease
MFRRWLVYGIVPVVAALGRSLSPMLFLGALSLYARQYPPTVPAPKPVSLPTPAVRVLANGLRVVVIERHSLPLITLRLVVKAGAEADPPNLPGTAQLVASLLDEGTESRTAQQIAAAIDQAGGTLQTGADWDNSFAAVNVLTDHTGLAFDLLSDIITHPAYAPEEIERQRKQTLSALAVMRNDPTYLADAVFNHFAFSGTPYSHPLEGTMEAVRGILPRDLRAFHAQYYRPSNSILAVAGDISAPDAFQYAERFFGAWKEGRQPAGVSEPSGPAEMRRIVVIDKPDAVQTEIRIGDSGVRRNSSEYDALTVANQILGGPATNRLFKALRSQHGLTYGASSDLVCYETVGSWVAKTSTRTPETIKTVQMVLDQLKRLRDHPISPSELDLAQNYLRGHLALDFETTEQVAAHILDLMIYNLPLDYWNRFPEALGRLNSQQIASSTREHLNPDRLVIVLVGNATAFENDLKELGPYQVIPVGSVDFASTNLENGAARQSGTGSSK